MLSIIKDEMRKRNMDMYLLDKFVSKLTLELTFESEEPLQIGAGREIGGPFDNPTLKVRFGNREVPVIPGSSLKGVLRSTMEALEIARGRLLHFIKISNREISCTGESLSEVFAAVKEHGLEKILTYEPNFVEKCLLSPIMILFGAPWMGARMKIGNLLPESYSTKVFRRTSIDRLTGSVSPSRLFSIEIIEPTTFKGRIVLNNVPIGNNPAYELFVESLVKLFEGIDVGKYKSVGLGRIRAVEAKGKYFFIANNEIVSEEVEFNGRELVKR